MLPGIPGKNHSNAEFVLKLNDGHLYIYCSYTDAAVTIMQTM